MTLVDVGANTEVRAEHLVQFAFMGAALAQVVHGVDKPRVALLSVGEEETRGSPLTIDVHARLATAPRAELRRQHRGPRARRGPADVVVTDGFTGNVALKVMEGVSDKMIALLKRDGDLVARARRPAAC